MKKVFLFAIAPLIDWHGNIDTYYAWDFNRPQSGERSYTTQPIKHDAFSLNLASLGVSTNQEKNRAKLVMQYGDSVDANYSAEEPNAGAGIKHIQEALVGFKVSENLWIDAGIYLGHIGNESWISKDNWNYSRGLLADFSPYYASGVRLSGTHKQNTWQMHLMNGWQNIRENNSGKALGFQYSWGDITSNSFLGHELSPSGGSGERLFHDLVGEIKFSNFSSRWALDLGAQRIAGERKYVAWGGASLQFLAPLNDNWRAGLRLEYFQDKKSVVTETQMSDGFQVYGASVNFDHVIDVQTLVRFELRTLNATNQIYPNKSDFAKHDNFLVTSLALGF